MFIKLLLHARDYPRLWRDESEQKDKVPSSREGGCTGGITARILTNEIWRVEVRRGIRSRISAAGFPGGAVVESLSANAGDTGSSPGLGRSHMPRSN